MTPKLLGYVEGLKRNVQAFAFWTEEANPQRIENSAGEDFSQSSEHQEWWVNY